MAMSKSFRTAQESVLCGLCETESKLTYKCLDCKLFMCDKCSEKVHPKFKNANQHKIIGIKEVGQTESMEKICLDFSNIPCEAHSEQFCCLYCTTCEKVVCSKCIPKYHTGHSFTEIENFYTKMLEKVNNTIYKLETQDQDLQKDEKKIAEIKEHKRNYSSLLEGIEIHKEALIKEIECQAKYLSSSVNELINSTEDFVTCESKNISMKRQTFVESKTKLETIKDTSNASDFFSCVPSILEQLQISSIYSQPPLVKFIPTYKQFPRDMMGSLEHAPAKPQQLFRSIQLFTKRTFSTNFQCCHSIAICSNGSFFIVGSIPKEQFFSLENIQLTNNTLNVIYSNKFPVITDVGIMSNKILLADRTPTLKLINVSTKEVSASKYYAGSLLIIAFHVTDEQKVVLGARSPGDIFPVQGKRVVIIMDANGNKITEWEYNQHGERIFSAPRPSASLNNGNIFILDYLPSSDRSRILILCPLGNVLNTYFGHSDINDEENPFTPGGMTRTTSDNILLCDMDNHALHLLSSDGTPLAYFITSKIGIEYPYCITLGNHPTILYIGCTSHKDSTEKTKLFEVDFSQSY